MAPLSVADDRFTIFQALANLLLEHHLYVFYTMDQGPMAPYYDLFDRLLAARSPALAQHLADCGIVCEMFLFGWWQTVFTKCLPLVAAARVWDVFLLDGFVHLYRVAAALLDLLQPHMLGASSSFEETIQLLTLSPAKAAVWEAISDPAALFPAVDAVVLPTEMALEVQDLVGDAFFFRHTGPARGVTSRVAPPRAASSGGAAAFATPIKPASTRDGGSGSGVVDPRLAGPSALLTPSSASVAAAAAAFADTQMPFGVHAWAYGVGDALLAGGGAAGAGAAPDGGAVTTQRRLSSSSLASSSSASGTGSRLVPLPAAPVSAPTPR